jgi:hypothetical protein
MGGSDTVGRATDGSLETAAVGLETGAAGTAASVSTGLLSSFAGAGTDAGAVATRTLDGGGVTMRSGVGSGTAGVARDRAGVT